MSNTSSVTFYQKSEVTRLLDAIRYTLTLIRDYNKNNDFDTSLSVPGTVKEYTYYTGIAAGNPSGATTNVETIEYKKDGVTLFTETYTYNADDAILTITTS